MRSILETLSKNIGLMNLSTINLFDYIKKSGLRSSTAMAKLKWAKHFTKWYCDICDSTKIWDINWDRLKETLPRDDAKEKRHISREEFSALINSLSDDWYKTVYKFMGSTCIRVRELSRLDGEDYDAASAKVTIPAKKTKANKTRTFYVPAELLKDFNKMATLQSGAPLVQIHGRRISPEGLGGMFASHCKNAGLGKRNIHLLRAYGLRMMLQGGATEMTIRSLAGWDSAEMRKYTDEMKQEKMELANNISFDSVSIDVGSEYLNIAASVLASLKAKKIDLKVVSAKTEVPYQWLHKTFVLKQNVDVELLLQTVKYLGYRLYYIGQDEINAAEQSDMMLLRKAMLEQGKQEDSSE